MNTSKGTSSLIPFLVGLSLLPLSFLLLGGVINFFERGFETMDWVLILPLLSYFAWAIVFMFKYRINKRESVQDSQMRTILKMAQHSNGTLGVVQVATELNLSTEASQHLLECIEAKGLAMSALSKHQVLEFRFPDFLPLSQEQHLKEPRNL